MGIYPVGPVGWHDDFSGTFRIVYQLTPQLKDNALEYAYMTLQLPHEKLTGPGQQCGNPPRGLAPAQLANRSLTQAGLPNSPVDSLGFSGVTR